MIQVVHERGLHLPEHDLWLDPKGAKASAFVSHAHSDHIARHAEVIATAATVRLMRERLRGVRAERVLGFGEPLDVRGGRVTLLPAGHVLGSAQLFFEGEAGSLLYTGDFKLRASLCAERTAWRHAGTLVMETTFGTPRHRMPPPEDVRAEIVAWCRRAMDDGAVPVLLAYSLGKTQELVCALIAAGLVPVLHESAWKVTRIYSELSAEFPGGYERFKPSLATGRVVIWPPGGSRAELAAKLPRHRTAMITGWALDPSAKYRYQCDVAFPLSDHADYDDLLRYVELVQPRRVLTVHGFAAEFAADLRRRGIEAWALAQANQLDLML
jgi:Cft2 family RNA processing exonuclease